MVKLKGCGRLFEHDEMTYYVKLAQFVPWVIREEGRCGGAHVVLCVDCQKRFGIIW